MIGILLYSNVCIFSQNFNENTTINVSKGFSGINLGDDYTTVTKVLNNNNPWYIFKEPEIASLSPNESLIISLEGKIFVKQIYLLFSPDNILQSISILLDEKKITYETMYQRFFDKYGRSNLLINQAVWTDQDTTLIMEKQPLQIKYIKNGNADTGADESEELKKEQELREDFLELF